MCRRQSKAIKLSRLVYAIKRDWLYVWLVEIIVHMHELILTDVKLYLKIAV